MKKALFVLLIFTLFLSGCGASAGTASISYKKSRYGDVPSEIGDTSKVKGIDLYDYSKKSEKNEYAPPTGKWFSFSGKGKGKIGGSITNGYQLPGAEVEFNLNSEPKGMNIRFQLTERDKNLKRLSVIQEQTSSKLSFTAKLPKKPDTFYLLSSEILDKSGRVEDTMTSLLYAITPKINAKFTAEKKIYHAGESIQLKLENFGPIPLMTGESSITEIYRNGRWMEIVFPGGKNSTGIGHGILPGKPYYEKNSEASAKGKYRVIKEVSTESYDLKQNLAAYFEIQ